MFYTHYQSYSTAGKDLKKMFARSKRPFGVTERNQLAWKYSSILLKPNVFFILYPHIDRRKRSQSGKDSVRHRRLPSWTFAGKVVVQHLSPIALSPRCGNFCLFMWTFSWKRVSSEKIMWSKKLLERALRSVNQRNLCSCRRCNCWINCTP